MEIANISKKIYEIQEARLAELGLCMSPEIVFIHLSEEIGEIARQLVNKNVPIRKYEEDNLKQEIVQALLDLLVLSELFKLDYEMEITKKILNIKIKQEGKM